MNVAYSQSENVVVLRYCKKCEACNICETNDWCYFSADGVHKWTAAAEFKPEYKCDHIPVVEPFKLLGMQLTWCETHMSADFCNKNMGRRLYVEREI